MPRMCDFLCISLSMFPKKNCICFFALGEKINARERVNLDNRVHQTISISIGDDKRYREYEMQTI